MLIDAQNWDTKLQFMPIRLLTCLFLVGFSPFAPSEVPDFNEIIFFLTTGFWMPSGNW